MQTKSSPTNGDGRLAPWTITQLALELHNDLKQCNTALERSCCIAINTREMRELADQKRSGFLPTEVMTREDILKDYDVSPVGIIKSPGKFEGEAIYVPYFWDAYLNGCADGDDGRVLRFKVSKEDRAMFPEIPKRIRTVRLYQRDDGFVCETR